MLHLKQILHKSYMTILEIILTINDGLQSLWSCSPKSVSGEPWDTAIKPEVASDYNSVEGSDLYLKFVVADRTDIDEAGRAVSEYRKAGIQCPVYLMPLGGRSEEYNPNVPRSGEYLHGERLEIYSKSCLGNLKPILEMPGEHDNEQLKKFLMKHLIDHWMQLEKQVGSAL